jgi:serine/threonine-protein kinase
VIFQMTTGRLPFKGETGIDMLHAIAYEAHPSMAELRPDMPGSLERAVSRCLAKSIDERYASCNDLIAELKHARRDVESGQSG